MNNLSRFAVVVSILSFIACKKDGSLNADDSIVTMGKPSKHVAVPIKGTYVTTNIAIHPQIINFPSHLLARHCQG